MSKNERLWPRPVMIPEPCEVAGVGQPIISLSGLWKLNTNPADGFWLPSVSPSSWQDVEVPSTLPALGIRVPNKQEYAYKTTLQIPGDFADKVIKIRFDAVNCLTRVWIDGRFIRSHWGGFNAWDADITPYVKAGSCHELTVGVTDQLGVASQFHYGGIIREARLIAVPKNHLERLHVRSDLDGEYRDATLHVMAKVSCVTGLTQLKLTLINPGGDPRGNNTNLGTVNVADDQDMDLSFLVENPLKWDAEHPRLYTLYSELIVDGVMIEVYRQNIGFRVVERREDQVFVNGREIKLRGVNREEVHPLKGRSISKQDIENDVGLLKEANVNFVRTSHYNPSKYFLDLCDLQGIYVENETSLSFIGQGQDFVNDDPAFLPHFMDQFAEMIEQDRSHPSVIIWSLANECIWGDNFRAMLAYVKQEDPSRLTIFSYPITMQQEDDMPDIWSAHYNYWYSPANLMSDNDSVGGWLGKHAYPVLHDEYIHVSCYNRTEIRRDQGVRDFWGESVKRFWDKIYDTKGALGGAIWGGIDEVWYCKDHPDATAEWGIIDGFRRKKPEHWLTKRGYSPIRIEAKELGNPGSEPLRIEVYNRYDHTNLKELNIRWNVGGESGQIKGPDVEPRLRGFLTLPPRDWKDSDVLGLQFVEASGLVCDEFRLPLTAKKAKTPELAKKAPHISNNQEIAAVSGEGFIYRFDQKTGMISLEANGELVIKDGPYLNLMETSLEPWQCTNFALTQEGDLAVAVICGSYGKIRLTYRIAIDADGMMGVSYTIDEMPYASPRRQMMGPVKIDVGGYSEVGLSFVLSSGIDSLSWNKDGLWDYYPEDHIGRREGMAKKFREGRALEESYRQTPEWDWKEDMRNFALFGRYDMGGRGTKDFVSTKTNFYDARVYRNDSGVGLEALSDGSDSIRLQLARNETCFVNDRDPRVKYYGSWQAYDDKYGCYRNTETRSNIRGDYVEFTFSGTGVCWIGKKHVIYGKAEVYIDGQLMDDNVSLMRMGGSGAIRGDERAYGEMLYMIEGLPQGSHTLRIVVKGERSEGRNMRSYNTYVSIDAFVVLGEHLYGDVLMHINGQFNYPELEWGNYVKDPIFVESGYQGQVFIRPYKKPVS